MTLPVHIIDAPWLEHKATLQHIRKVVFIEEQEVPQELEWDGCDEDSRHFLAVNELGQYIGCARLLTDGQIGRMAVLKEYRGTGVGALLLQAAIVAGKEASLDRLFLHAQTYAQEFYKKAGFLAYGNEFSEAGIAHISMEMKLPLPFLSPPTPSNASPMIRQQPMPEKYTLPVSKPQPFDSFTECRAALETVLESAKRRVLILSPYLDHELFDRDPVAQTLSSLARSAPKAEIQILIFDSKLIVDRGHQVVELARRLDQKVKIRTLGESSSLASSSGSSSSFVCADFSGYWLLPSFENYDGISDLANPVTCKRLIDVFETAWAKSKDDTELRTLRL